MTKKRLFFAFKILAPWPHNLPKGRPISEDSRHLTAAFLGDVESEQLIHDLNSLPRPPSLGLAGSFDQCIFLPKGHPNVAAWSISWLEDASKLMSFQRELVAWLKQKYYFLARREWLQHVTMARQPFEATEWQRSFAPLPLLLGDFCLYESLGNLTYIPLWSKKTIPAFTEIEHTADYAFHVHAASLNQLYKHAAIALAFKFPSLMPFFEIKPHVRSLDALIFQLNHFIHKADRALGCSIKPITFHGEIEQLCPRILKWEMIILGK